MSREYADDQVQGARVSVLPSTEITWPDIFAPAGDARKLAMPAISSVLRHHRIEFTVPEFSKLNSYPDGI
jgi:hypothetical protein